MLKKTVFASLAVLALSSPAFAIELPEGQASGFNTLSTAYPSSSFNTILEGYGLSLPAENVAEVPKPYAKVAGDKPVFNNVFKAYNPVQYDAIFKAYGLKLSPEMVSEKLAISHYATVKDGVVVFGAAKLAFNGGEWENILSAYELANPPAPAVVPAAAVAPAKMAPKDSDADGVIDANDECPGTPKGVVVDDRGCWALTAGLLFDLDSSEIKSDFIPALERAKKVFETKPGLKVQVEGHADSTGAAAYNQKLSEKRANAVVDYLVNGGVSADRLTAVGYGEERPAYTNDTKAGRAKNRRVEFSPVM
ncbi:OmpA family protein [Desulfosediminicola flagellatus]|uniref:OmpA family protein n=1 Tax=Desulfosediminicola flagellatus TaxID=2569541 RepID=UPI0010AC3A34|nr:OmpA family protein [Desulfosediminicola flagellatus]